MFGNLTTPSQPGKFVNNSRLFGNITTPSPDELIGNITTPSPDGLFGNITTPSPDELFGNITTLSPDELIGNITTPSPDGLFGNITTPSPDELIGNITTPSPDGLFGNITTSSTHGQSIIKATTIPMVLCDLPDAPPDALKLGTKCIRVEEGVLTHQLGGVSHCATQHRAELLTISSEEEFDQLIRMMGGSEGDVMKYWVDAGDRDEEGIVRWQGGEILLSFSRYAFRLLFCTSLPRNVFSR